MRALLVGVVLVPFVDLGVKRVLHHWLGPRALSLGPLGRVQLLTPRLWLVRVLGRVSPAAMATVWLLAAAPLVVVSVLFPSSGAFIGLLLGGALSNGLESSLRGSVSDYVCLRFWPAFNLADVALTVGAIGIALQLTRV